MKILVRTIARVFLPEKIRHLILSIIPKFYLINTYIIKNPKFFENLPPIDSKYLIRQVVKDDLEKLIKFELARNPKKAERKIKSRLSSDAWIALCVIDKTNDIIAYYSWIIIKSIPYFEEFGIQLTDGQFLLKDGFCAPDYRHQGLHTRMEQERINYCVRNGAKEIFIQIHDSNEKGKDSVINNGYNLYRQNYVLSLPAFNVFREMKSFLKNPFKKIIK